jgi:DHA1 family multidrug resistance protein-like MFS transporter
MLIVLCIVGWAATFSDSILFPVIPLYAAELGASVSEAGFIIAVYSYVTALLTVPSGRVSDKVGVRRFMILGLGVFVLAPLLYPLVNKPGQLIWVRMFHGLAYAFFLPSGFAAAAALASPERRGEAMGWYTMSAHLGHTLGPITGGFILKRWGFEAAFVASSVVAVLGFLLTLLRIPAPQHNRSQGTQNVSWGNWLRQKPLQACLLMQFVIAFGMGNIGAYLPLYCRSIGLTSVGAGLILTALFASSTVTRAPAGRLSDQIGGKPMMLLGMTLIVLAVGSLSLFQTLSYLVLSGILFGMGMGISAPALLAQVAKSSSPEMLGVSMGITTFSFHLGLAVGPTSMGYVAKGSGFEIMFLLCASVLGAGLLASTGLLRKPEGR